VIQLGETVADVGTGEIRGIVYAINPPAGLASVNNNGFGSTWPIGALIPVAPPPPNYRPWPYGEERHAARPVQPAEPGDRGRPGDATGRAPAAAPASLGNGLWVLPAAGERPRGRAVRNVRRGRATAKRR